ncbi:MAG: NADH-quinone oxidoreductase subunit J [Bacteroidia bacterium]|nr:NADH-quinone oxidoreductase subunit J [Bacteroidia bacterium]MCX7764336.1 NADH-quinone oxidoreductase subunit J [Bacteroidia bacterium]MDW8056950.1 NADH-quinone oxidoreductase subunit J [Bacteroidia bacterium]
MLTLIALGIFGVIALTGGALAVVLRDPIYAVLSLVKAMLGLAAVYFILGAEYIGAIQVIVYAGAILVTFLFVVMLVNLTPADIPPLPRGLNLYGALILAITWMVTLSIALKAVLELPDPEEAMGMPTDQYLFGTLPPIGKALFTAYALPFEVLSITLVVGIVGASLLAQKRHEL